MKHAKGGRAGRMTLGLLVAVGLLWGEVPVSLADPAVAPVAVGSAAPDFGLTLFSGEQVHLADFRGKVLLLNFWASW